MDSCKISAAATPPSHWGHSNKNISNNKAKAFAVIVVVAAAITGFLFRYEHCDNYCNCLTEHGVK